MVFKNASIDALYISGTRTFGDKPGTTRPKSGLNRSARIWFAASVVIGAVLAIVLHAVVGSFVVVANELSFGVLGRTLGAEIVASIWALLAFSGSAYIFFDAAHRRETWPVHPRQ